MIYRTISILVIGFWLTMSALLVRKEAGPRDSALREVPVAHVVKLILMHGQPSDLLIYSGKARLGYLRIHPQLRQGDRSRFVAFVGNLQIILPGMERQRVRWDGEIELEKTLATRHFAMRLIFNDIATRNSPGYRAQLTIAPAENLLTFRSGDQSYTYTLDEAGLQSALREILDPSLLTQLQSQTRSIAPPVIRALQSSMLIRGERIDTYLVTIEQNGQTLLEFDVSQLGQILRAKTLIGYSLAPEDLVP